MLWYCILLYEYYFTHVNIYYSMIKKLVFLSLDISLQWYYFGGIQTHIRIYHREIRITIHPNMDHYRMLGVTYAKTKSTAQGMQMSRFSSFYYEILVFFSDFINPFRTFEKWRENWQLGSPLSSALDLMGRGVLTPRVRLNVMYACATQRAQSFSRQLEMWWSVALPWRYTHNMKRLYLSFLVCIWSTV